MSDIYQDLKRGLGIDKNNLDDALIEQPELFWKVSEEYTNARSEQDQIKFEISQLESELGAEFREAASKAGDKLTVDGLKQQIAGDPGMQKLQQKLVDAASNVGRFGALKEAYDQRASMLKALCQLYASNYYATSTGSGDRNQARERLGSNVREEAGRARQDYAGPRTTRVRPQRGD